MTIDKLSRPTIAVEDKLYPQVPEDYSHLRGKTLEVYYYLVDHDGPVGVREIQRALNYNSPSIAAYHLARLWENHLIQKTEQGSYFVDGDPVKLGPLKDHVQVAGQLVPRILLYGVQGLVSILLAIILYVTGASPELWLGFFLTINLLFIIIVIKDSISISGQLSQQE